MNYTELKKQALEKFFSRTNPQQRRAIFRTDGAVLIIAGAGSGKTTVLCNRIANLLLFGDAYHSDDYIPDLTEDDYRFLKLYVDGCYPESAEITGHLSEIIGYKRPYPWKILAVTFTNKAANELKERLSSMNVHAADVWAGTFHSVCVKILRRNIDILGYNKNFVIYDTDDSKRVIKNALSALNLSEKTFSPKVVANAISRAKDKLLPPERFPVTGDDGKPDFMLSTIRDIYIEYQKLLKASNALDFDDIIMKTVELFRTDASALQYWQNHFDYVMVDEYQDTNMAQYELVKLISGGKGNLCVVGDEDQSIYRFRGATIENILSFENEFGGEVIKLEQNYRSTENILNAANEVIRNNTQHKDKTLWSDLGEGEKIDFYRFPDEKGEAMYIASEILSNVEKGGKFSDHAILYRNNAQSRNLEIVLGKTAVPYKIVGGTRFYDRKEIRDAIAYLRVICNPYDMVSLERIINEPKRGIGDATWAEIRRTALGMGMSPIEVMEHSDEFAALTKKSKKLIPVGRMFRELSESADERSITDIFDDIMEQSGYTLMLIGLGDEGADRLQNIKELKSSMITFTEENEDTSLFNYLEQVALISDLDGYDSETDRVTLMTMHSAKGLEFERVFIVGAEENIFPSYRSLTDIYELEEDRRLCYVAITRAKKKLYITTAKVRLLYGQTMCNKISRFVNEIPRDYLEVHDLTVSSVFGSGESRQPKPNYLREQAEKRTETKTPVSTESFSTGDRINHKIFGEGTVLNSTPLGNDTLLEISFDKSGTKRLMANFAKITKI